MSKFASTAGGSDGRVLPRGAMQMMGIIDRMTRLFDRLANVGTTGGAAAAMRQTNDSFGTLARNALTVHRAVFAMGSGFRDAARQTRQAGDGLTSSLGNIANSARGASAALAGGGRAFAEMTATVGKAIEKFRASARQRMGGDDLAGGRSVFGGSYYGEFQKKVGGRAGRTGQYVQNQAMRNAKRLLQITAMDAHEEADEAEKVAEAGATDEGRSALAYKAANARRKGLASMRQYLLARNAEEADRLTPEGQAGLRESAESGQAAVLQDLRERFEVEKALLGVLQSQGSQLREQAELQQRIAASAQESARAAAEAARAFSSSPEGQALGEKSAANSLLESASSARDRASRMAAAVAAMGANPGALDERNAAGDAASRLDLKAQLLEQESRRRNREAPGGLAALREQQKDVILSDTNKARERADAEEQATRAVGESLSLIKQRLEAERRIADAVRERQALERAAMSRYQDKYGEEDFKRRHLEQIDLLREEAKQAERASKYWRSAEGRRNRRSERSAREGRKFYSDQAEGGALFATTELLNGRLERVKDGMKGLFEVSQRTFAAISVGFAGLASVGDPFAGWNTLSGSFKMVAQTVGEILTPVMIQLSAQLQGVDAWIRSLSGEFKTNALRVAMWVTGAAGGVIMTYKLITAVQALNVALGGLGRALGASLAGLAIGVVGALAAEYVLLGDKASYASRAVGDFASQQSGVKSPRANLAPNALTAEDLRGAPAPVRAAVEAAGGDRTKIAAALRAFELDAERRKRDMEERQLPQLAAKQQYDRRMSLLLGEDFKKADKYQASQQAEGRKLLGLEKSPAGRWIEGFENMVAPWSVMQRNAALQMGFNRSDAAEAKRLSNEAIESLKKRNIPVFEDFERGDDGKPDFARRKRFTDAQLDRARDMGMVPESDVYARMAAATRRGAGTDPENWFKNDVKNFGSGAMGLGINKLMTETNAAKDLAAKLMDRSGSKGFLENMRWPTPPTISDPLAFADRLQVQALEGGEADKEILRRQLIAAEQTQKDIAAMRMALERMADQAGAPPPVRGPKSK